MPHPPAGQIEPIHLLGTTWYERGPGYWLRRAGLSLAYLLSTVVCGWITTLMVHAFWTEPEAGGGVRWALTLIVAAIVVASAAQTARAFNREYAGVTKRRNRPLGAAVGFIGLARPIIIGGLAITLGAFIGFGGAAMMFLYSLRPEFFGEHQARLRHEQKHHQKRQG